MSDSEDNVQESGESPAWILNLIYSLLHVFIKGPVPIFIQPVKSNLFLSSFSILNFQCFLLIVSCRLVFVMITETEILKTDSERREKGLKTDLSK